MPEVVVIVQHHELGLQRLDAGVGGRSAASRVGEVDDLQSIRDLGRMRGDHVLDACEVTTVVHDADVPPVI